MKTASDASTRAGFAAVDDDPDSHALVAALDEQAHLPAIQRLRSTAVGRLAPAPGSRVLDAGCGVGDMTRDLATRVTPGGTVIGIDISTTMIAEARRRIADAALPAEFRHGDITRLDLAAGSLDGAYSERVFQHLEDPEAALAELMRVTRPGGQIVVVDTDWGMHAVQGAEPSLTARVLGCWAENTTNGWSGRRLPTLFANAGLADPTLVADTIIATSARPPALEPFATMASLAEQHGAVTGHDARRWLTQLADADARGLFFWAVTMFLVAGTRP